MEDVAMKNFRKMVNALSLGVIAAGVVALSPARGNAIPPAENPGGTCCDQSGATCYLTVGGTLIIQSGAYYSSGPCAATPANPPVEA
jgi:hypothetical protein